MGLQNRYADMVLNLLVRPEEINRQDKVSALQLGDVDWNFVLQLAQRNVITIRLFEALQDVGIAVPNRTYRNVVEAERARIRRMMELINRISEVLEREGIEYVFMKSFQHYPDMGEDADLLVLDRSSMVDLVIINSLRASVSKGSLSHKLAGKQGYEIHGYSSPLEIHHGRLGHVGEHSLYPKILTRNRQRIRLDGITTFIPSPEDQLIIQVLQRIYSHLCIRLSDVIHAVSLIRREDLKWDYVLAITRRVGIFEGLCCYLSYITQIHKELFGTDAVPPEWREVLVRDCYGKVHFQGRHYSFPVALVLSKVYSKEILALVESWDGEGVARLCLLPPLAILVGLRLLGRWSSILPR